MPNTDISSQYPCFEGNVKVKLGDGSQIAVKDLKRGMDVWTLVGKRQVAAILKTRVDGVLCKVGDLLVTEWYPIMDKEQWVFSGHIAEEQVPFKGDVFSVLLAPEKNPSAHTIMACGRACTTLGHGILSKDTKDARGHLILGNYDKVDEALRGMDADEDGHSTCERLGGDYTLRYLPGIGYGPKQTKLSMSMPG